MKSSKKGISVLNVPLLRKQLDADFALGLRTGSMGFGGDFQGALAVTDHIVLMANINVYGRSWDATDPFGNEYEGAHSGNLSIKPGITIQKFR